MRVNLFLLVLFFTSTLQSSYAQHKTVETLFNTRAYSKVIDCLTTKQVNKQLTYQEYYFLSRSYGRNKQYGNGYVLANEIIRKARKEKDTANIILGYQLKIEHVIDLNKIKEGVHLCDSILPACRKKDSVIFMKMCFPCGVLYNIDKQHLKAYNTYKKITKPKYKRLSLYRNNFGTILLKLEKHEEAIALFKRDLELKKTKRGVPNYTISTSYHNIGVSYLNLRRFDLSKIYLDSAYNSLHEKSDLRNKKNIFDSYFLLYKLKRNKNLAHRYLDSVLLTNEKMLIKRIDEHIVSISEANTKELFLKKEVRYVDNKLERTKQIILQSILIFIIVIFVLILIFFFFRYRNIQSTYKNLLIDRTLSWVKLKPSYINKSMQSMQEMIETDNPKSIRYLSKFSKFLRLLLENSRKTTIPITHEITTIKHFLEIQQIEHQSPFDFKISTDEAITYEELYIPPMLVQPFIDIAIDNCKRKTNLNAEITIHFSYTNETLTCIISDNGERLNKLNFQQKITQKNIKELFNAFSKKLNTSSKITFKNIRFNEETKNSIILILPHKTESYD